STAASAAFRKLSLVCCITPGIEPTGCGSLIPSLTNSGWTRSAGCRLVLATRRRMACVLRSLRGLACGNPAAIIRLLWRLLPEPPPGAAATFARAPYRLSGCRGRFPHRCPVRGQRLDEERRRRILRDHVDPQAELGGSLRGL